jgi:hypothetical protein
MRLAVAEAGMSDLDDWKARNVPFATFGNGDRFIRCGLGRKGQRWSYGGAPHDSVLAREWEDLGEAALTTEHAQFHAADLDGLMVGQAFLERVIKDPKVQAAGQWLCLERPQFSQLFKEGTFPAVMQHRNQRSSPIRTRRLPPYANVGYSDLKEHWRRPPTGTLANSDLITTSAATRPSSSLVWDRKWPLVLDANKLSHIFISEYSLDADYQKDPFEGPIYHAAKAVADRHHAFFNLVRAHLLVAEGTFKDTGQELPIPDKQWSRQDRYLDVQNSDLFNKEGESAHVMWESVTLRLPNQDEMTKPRRTRPVDRALEGELKKRGLADGRNGRTDNEIAYDLVDQRLSGEELERAVDRKRQQIKRYYQRRGKS